MLVEQLIQYLQNLTKQKITQKDLGDALGISKQAIGNKKADNYEFAEYEIKKIKDYVISKYSDNKCTLVDNNDSVTIDYYPDVFGSCGNGVFELSPEKTQIIVPKNAFFEKFSPNKTYSVINAHGNSMQPLIFDKDKLIIEHWNGEQIIDNKPYIFCYKDEIFIKRLAKNVDQLMIISENKDYDTRKLEGEQLKDVNIIGQIVGLMRDLR